MSRYAAVYATSSTRQVVHEVAELASFTRRTVCGLPIQLLWELHDERPEGLRLCLSCEARGS